MLPRPLQRLLRRSRLDPFLQAWDDAYRQRREYERWLERGRPGRAVPHRVKQAVLRAYGAEFGLRTLVETGTYTGAMLHALRRDFDRFYSIEIDRDLAERAQRRFRSDPRVEILCGDSGTLLPRVLEKLATPALFWLDGHYSGPGTSAGVEASPVAREVGHVVGHAVGGHVIVIDDARYFVGKDGYPTLEELRQAVAALRPELELEEAQGLIHIHPQRVVPSP